MSQLATQSGGMQVILMTVTLGQAMRTRRAELRMSQEQVAAAADLATKTVSQLERDTSNAPEIMTLAKLDQALKWHSGTAAALATGVDVDLTAAIKPDPPIGVAAADLVDRRALLSPEVQAIVDGLIDRLLESRK